MKDAFLEWKTGEEEITSLTGLFKGKTQNSGADLICINIVHCIYIYILCVCECSVAQSCPTLCNSMDGSLPDSSVHGVFQAGILE